MDYGKIAASQAAQKEAEHKIDVLKRLDELTAAVTRLEKLIVALKPKKD